MEFESGNLLSQVLEIVEEVFMFFGKYMPLVYLLAAIISAVCLAAIIFLTIRMIGMYRSDIRASDVYYAAKQSKKRVMKGWKKVKERMEADDDANWRLAIIEADKILDEMLKAAGYSGETIGERLKNVKKAEMSNLEAVWRAHKFRNRIVHEAGYQITKEEAEGAIGAYRQVFLEFGLIRE